MELNTKNQFFPYEDINKTENTPTLTYTLIGINIIIFIISLTDFEKIIYTYGFISTSPSTLTIITSMFLHGGIGHIFGNMWYLWLFGDNIEDKFGKIKYILAYLCAGIVALATQYAIYPTTSIPIVGASGAISGILGAYLVLFPQVEVKTIGPFYQIFRIKAKYLIALWFVLQIMFGTLSIIGEKSSNIAFFAHIGGFIFGVLTGILYKITNKKKKHHK